MSLRIALIGNAMSTMERFRGPLIVALRELGHEVIAICPTGTSEEIEALTSYGARHIPLEHMSRAGLDPRSEMALLRDLTALLRETAPDRVFSYFLKPAIWGSIAAKRAGVPRNVAMIEGMGYAFSTAPLSLAQQAKQTIARLAVLQLLKISCRSMDHLIVLNKDDAQLIRDQTTLSESDISVLDGIGVDFNHFTPAAPHVQPIRFLLATRLIREKGVELFAECASRVKEFHPNVCFRLLGGVDDAQGALSAETIKQWVQAGLIEWPGKVKDIRPHLQESSVFVLPTLYREGLPRSIMEAMAMGRPVVTSDMPGARGSISDGISGFVHKAGDLDALVADCLTFCNTPDKIAQMGQNALNEARRRYALPVQNKRQIELILG